jgi:23S rRNA (adenine2503-C2)-methyltransferase
MLGAMTSPAAPAPATAALPHLRDLPAARLGEELAARGFLNAAARGHRLGIDVHREGALAWEDLAAHHGKDVRRELARHFDFAPRLSGMEVRHASDEHTRKYLFRVGGGEAVEFVLIRHWDDHTLCVSSQAGCAMGCTFCATGRLALRRNLAPGEITEALVRIQRDAGVRVTDVVFMGMGEPLHNYDAVMTACGNLNHAAGHGIARKRITVSTVGLVREIRRFTRERRPWRLHVSLHSAIQEVRERIVPSARTNPLPELLDAVREHQRELAVKWVTFQYVALPGVNLDAEHVAALGRELQGIRCILNVIPWNETGVGGFRAPTWDEVRDFTSALRPLGFPVKVRYSAGKREGMGCGQLAAETFEAVPSGHMVAPPGIFTA